MDLVNTFKRILSFCYLGFINYNRYKNYQQDSLELKDRLNNYNMKYPQTKFYNDYLLKETTTYHFGLIFNFIVILSSVFLGIKSLGFIAVLFFIITELHLFNDVIFNLYHKIFSQTQDVVNIFYAIPIDNLIIFTMIFGILALSFKPKNN